MADAGALAGKRVLVTGGSRGLGREMCVQFAAQGARVAFSYQRDAKAAEAAITACGAVGVPARAFCASVLDPAATDAMVKTLEAEWGGLDALVNNAGITQNLPFALMDVEDWDEVMDVNVKGTFLTTKAVLRGMIRQRAGVVLNIGSLAGERGIDAPVHYCTSKAALRGFTESLAKEMGRYGIRVVCLAPGLLEDGVGKKLPEHRLADYLKHCVLGRVGTFDEVARLAAFLISDEASFVSGATLLADGGL
jgi:3-oxoacyl-[acyl-carrier protein] reductase